MNATDTFNRIEQTSKAILHKLQDKSEYISEPGLDFVKNSLNAPSEKLLHPISTSKSLLQTIQTTLHRTTEVAGEGISY